MYILKHCTTNWINFVFYILITQKVHFFYIQNNENYKGKGAEKGGLISC